MAFTVKTGLTAPQGFLKELFELDKLVYSPELCGIYENLEARFKFCPDSFVIVYDESRIAGYVNIFPIGDKLYNEMNDPDFKDCVTTILNHLKWTNGVLTNSTIFLLFQ